MIDANARATVALLCERFLKTFFMFEQRRRPLKIGVHLDIAAALPAITAEQIRAAMRCYVANRFYNKSCIEGAPRIDLDGNEAGVVTAEQAANSKHRVAGAMAARERKIAAAKEAAARANAEALAAARAAGIEAANAAAPTSNNPNFSKPKLQLGSMRKAS
jgi:ProP effector